VRPAANRPPWHMSLAGLVIGAKSLIGARGRHAGCLAVATCESTQDVEVCWVHTTPSMVVAYQTADMDSAVVTISRADAGALDLDAENFVSGGSGIRLPAGASNIDRPHTKRQRT